MVTMLAMTVGVVVFGHQTDLLTSWRWTAVGLLFSMVLYFMESYTAFFGGIILSIYTMSLWPLLAKRVVNFPPHKIIPVAMLVTIFYIVLSAWVVAYNFVPGGTLTRERTDVMLIMLVLSCGLGSRNASTASDVKVQSLGKKRLPRKVSQVNFLGRVIRRLSTVTEEGEGDEIGSWGSEGSETHQVLSKQVSEAEDSEAQVFHTKVLKGELAHLSMGGYSWMCRCV